MQAQREAGKAIPHVTDCFDVYDLAALAYLYKRIKETDGIREASHIIIDEAQDFGMMAYGALAYCLRGCTYTIMGDVSQNIYFGYGLNDWEELQKLILTGTFDSFGLLKKVTGIRWKSQTLPQISCGMEIFRFIRSTR